MFMLLFNQGSGESRVEPVEGGADQTEQTNLWSPTGKLLRTFVKTHHAHVAQNYKKRVSLQENEQLRGSLLKAETDIAVLLSELDTLKNMHADQNAQHER